MSHYRIYLRVSTKEQDVNRAEDKLIEFVKSNSPCATFSIYRDSTTGTTANRSALNDLMREASEGDVLLVEKIDRLSRMKFDDWESLLAKMKSKGIRLISLDAPTTFILAKHDETTDKLMSLFASMMLDILAVFARKDYEDRRERANEGIARTKKSEPHKYQGRKLDENRYRTIVELTEKGFSISKIASTLGISESTVKRARAWGKQRAGQK